LTQLHCTKYDDSIHIAGHEMTESGTCWATFAYGFGENLTKALVKAHIASKAVGHLSSGFRFSVFDRYFSNFQADFIKGMFNFFSFLRGELNIKLFLVHNYFLQFNFTTLCTKFVKFLAFKGRFMYLSYILLHLRQHSHS